MRPLKLIPDNTNIHFLKWRGWAMALSVALIAASIALVAVRGLNLGVDFVGGQMFRVTFEKSVQVDELRSTIGSLGLGEPSIQEIGKNQVSIRMQLPKGGEDAANAAATKVRAAVSVKHPDARFDAVEAVSGKVSQELLQKGVLSLGLAMFGIALYIWFRFEWQFGIGALFSLFHDVSLTFGFFALTQLQFDLNVVGAILTIIGYSLNDTIVVYDRIRETLKKFRKLAIEPLLDLAVNETLSRTMVTSASLMLTLIILLVFGPDVIFGFTAAMLLGIVIGTYSSVYVAAPILIWLKVGSDSFVPKDDSAGAGKSHNEGYLK
jgi:preprotein translocase subunit SecF